MRHRTLLITSILAAVLLWGCNGDPTEVRAACVDQTTILANDAAYIARPEALTEGPGRLTKNCFSNPRYCYYLGPVRVYTLGNTTVLDSFVGQDVVIVGKAVFPAEGPGELWAGTICRLTR